MEENKTENTTTPTPTEPVVENTAPVEKQQPTVNPAPEPTTQTSTNPPPKKKKKIGLKISIIVIILAILIGAIGAAVYYLCFAAKEVDLSKYISIDFDGYEGYLTVKKSDIVIDEKSIKKDINDSKLAKKLIEKIEDGLEIEDATNLENGDEIIVKVDIKDSWLEKNKLKLKSDKLKFKVEGLEEPEQVDIFKDIDFEVSGISPDLTVTLVNSSSDEFIKDIEFTMEDESGNVGYLGTLYEVKSGEKITVTASYTDKDLKKTGYTIKDNTYIYTVKDAPEYVLAEETFNSKAQTALSEEFIKELDEDVDYYSYAAVSSIDETVDYSDKFTASKPELVNLYLLIDKDAANNSLYWDINRVYGIYKVIYTSSTTSNTYEYYYTVYCKDVAVDKDGLYDNDYYYDVSYAYDSSEYAKSATDAYNYFIAAEKDDFNIITIK